jgi:hypothetical protein
MLPSTAPPPRQVSTVSVASSNTQGASPAQPGGGGEVFLVSICIHFYASVSKRVDLWSAAEVYTTAQPAAAAAAARGHVLR